MKEGQKIKRIRLDVGPENDSYLLGIVSAEPDYKLSLILNSKFSISLRNTTPVTITDDDNELTFSRFSDTSGSPDLIFDLVSNRTGKCFLLKKLKNIDFVFVVFDPERSSNIDRIITKMREIDCITAVFNIDAKTIRDRNLHYLTR